jgi:hypothetical protein
MGTSLVVAARLVVAEEPTLAARWLGLSAALHKLTAQDRMRAEVVAGEAQERLSRSAFEAAWNAGYASVSEVEAQLDTVERRLQARSSVSLARPGSG